MEDATDWERQRQELARAAEAGAAGDLEEMVTALYRSGYLDGLRRILAKRCSEVPHPELDYAVSRGVDALYESVRDGRKIRNVGAFLYKVAFRRALDYARLRARESLTLDEAEWPAHVADKDPDIEDPDALRAEALRHARRLLPQLGQTNVQRVMAMVLDAVEAQVDDLSNEDIATALGLSIDTVKQSKSRGFRRLRRLAHEEGLAGPSLIRDLKDDSDGEYEA